MKLIKFAGLVLAGTVAASGLAACSSGGYGDGDVYPPAYGQYYGSAWHCYYVHDAYEATQLINTGHCHYGDVPTLMPLWWHERYFTYYSGGAYVNHFVLASYRPTYRTVYVTNFGRTYHSQIQSQSRLATWKTRSGKTVSGTKVQPKFTSGTSGKRYGGGSSRTGGGSSRTKSGGGSFGGGSSRRSSGGSFGGGSSRRR